MTKKPDGGPAYPLPDSASATGRKGMTKREWFAGHALQGLLSANIQKVVFSLAKDRGIEVDAYVAMAAFEYADAMIAESEK